MFEVELELEANGKVERLVSGCRRGDLLKMEVFEIGSNSGLYTLFESAGLGKKREDLETLRLFWLEVIGSSMDGLEKLVLDHSDWF